MPTLWNTLRCNQEYPITKEQAAEVKKAHDGINEYYEKNIKTK